LPVFGMDWQVQLRAGVPKPIRLSTDPGPGSVIDRPSQLMMRAPDLSPAVFDVTEAWGDDGFPGGWQSCQEDLIDMVEIVLNAYRTDPDRVYLTGLSYGGNGTWHMAITYPERWAAIAPICGDGNSALATILAAHQLPIWMFHGGRDTLNKPQWAYDIANALERAGHQSVRFTVHEDCGHDCWTRVYGGQDLYEWFLHHRRQ
jgi:predicted peptidase